MPEMWWVMMGDIKVGFQRDGDGVLVQVNWISYHLSRDELFKLQHNLAQVIAEMFPDGGS